MSFKNWVPHAAKSKIWSQRNVKRPGKAAAKINVWDFERIAAEVLNYSLQQKAQQKAAAANIYHYT